MFLLKWEKYKEFILIDVHIYDFAFMSTFLLVFCNFDINIAVSAIFPILGYLLKYSWKENT